MNKVIQEQDVEKLVEYLKTKPYGEVKDLIVLLQDLPAIETLIQYLPELIEE